MAGEGAEIAQGRVAALEAALRAVVALGHRARCPRHTRARGGAPCTCGVDAAADALRGGPPGPPALAWVRDDDGPYHRAPWSGPGAGTARCGARAGRADGWWLRTVGGFLGPAPAVCPACAREGGADS